MDTNNINEWSAPCVIFGSIALDNSAHMDFQWCSEIPRGQEKPTELVRGLENSRTISGLARPCMQYMHGLVSPEISPGVLKTSNQFYSTGSPWPPGTSLHH